MIYSLSSKQSTLTLWKAMLFYKRCNSQIIMSKTSFTSSRMVAGSLIITLSIESSGLWGLSSLIASRAHWVYNIFQMWLGVIALTFWHWQWWFMSWADITFKKRKNCERLLQAIFELSTALSLLITWRMCPMKHTSTNNWHCFTITFIAKQSIILLKYWKNLPMRSQ